MTAITTNPSLGDVVSIMFTGREPDPENEGKTVLIRRLVSSGEVMDVRGGDFMFQPNGDFTWTFPEATAPRPKNLDVYINQNPVFGADAYIDVLFRWSCQVNWLSCRFCKALAGWRRGRHHSMQC